jgi:hypothetical protein
MYQHRRTGLGIPGVMTPNGELIIVLIPGDVVSFVIAPAVLMWMRQSPPVCGGMMVPEQALFSSMRMRVAGRIIPIYTYKYFQRIYYLRE